MTLIETAESEEVTLTATATSEATLPASAGRHPTCAPIIHYGAGGDNLADA